MWRICLNTRCINLKIFLDLWRSPWFIEVTSPDGCVFEARNPPEVCFGGVTPFLKRTLPLVSLLLSIGSLEFYHFKWSFFVVPAFCFRCLFCRTFWMGREENREGASRKKLVVWVEARILWYVLMYFNKLVCDLLIWRLCLSVPIQGLEEPQGLHVTVEGGLKDGAQLSCFLDKEFAAGRLLELLRLFWNSCLSETFWGPLYLGEVRSDELSGWNLDVLWAWVCLSWLIGIH